MSLFLKFLVAAVAAGTPLLFGTVGEILNEKVGHLNLGVEGMMALGACAGFMTAYLTDSLALALLASFAAGVLASLIYAVLTVTFLANQNVAGLTLTIFGTGLSNFIGVYMISRSAEGTLKLPAKVTAALAAVHIPGLSDAPVVGELLFSYNVFVYLGVAVALAAGWYLYGTKTGLNVQAIGENPGAADAASIPVNKFKYINLLLGGGICGIGRRVLQHDHQRRRVAERQRGRLGLDRSGAGHLCRVEAAAGHSGQLCVRRPSGAEVLCAHRRSAHCLL